MRPTLLLRAAQARKPSIKFLGKRSFPKTADHTPQPHPASPTHSLPDSFANYRQKAQQHGPLGGQNDSPTPSPSPSSSSSSASSRSASLAYGAIGGTAGKNLGPIQPKDGEYFDVSELPRRFQKRVWSESEMDAVSSAGASMW